MFGLCEDPESTKMKVTQVPINKKRRNEIEVCDNEEARELQKANYISIKEDQNNHYRVDNKAFMLLNTGFPRKKINNVDL